MKTTTAKDDVFKQIFENDISNRNKQNDPVFKMKIFRYILNILPGHSVMFIV